MLVTCNSASNHRQPAALLRPVAAMSVLVALALSPAASPLALGQAPELRPANQTALPAPSPLAVDAQSVAADAPRTSLAEALDRPGDVSFRNMTIEAALFTLGDTWKVNVVTGKELQGTVNGVFKQAPLREILYAILLANG